MASILQSVIQPGVPPRAQPGDYIITYPNGDVEVLDGDLYPSEVTTS